MLDAGPAAATPLRKWYGLACQRETGLARRIQTSFTTNGISPKKKFAYAASSDRLRLLVPGARFLLLPAGSPGSVA
jgi:hypothetical protein